MSLDGVGGLRAGSGGSLWGCSVLSSTYSIKGPPGWWVWIDMTFLAVLHGYLRVADRATHALGLKVTLRTLPYLTKPQFWSLDVQADLGLLSLGILLCPMLMLRSEKKGVV